MTLNLDNQLLLFTFYNWHYYFGTELNALLELNIISTTMNGKFAADLIGHLKKINEMIL